MEYSADHQVKKGDQEAAAPLSYVHHNSVKRFSIRFKAPKPPSPAATDKGKKPMMINSMEKGFSTNDDTSCDLCKKRFESLKKLYFHLKKKHSSNDWKPIFMSGSSENYKEHNAEEEVVDLRNCMRGNWGAVKKRKRGAGGLAGLQSSSEIADDDDDEEVRNAAMNLMHLIKASHDHRYSNRRSNSSIMGELAAASSSSICAQQRKQRIVFYAGDVEKAAEALLLLPRNADHPSSMAEAESSSSGNVNVELHSELVKSLYDGLEVVRNSFDLNQPPPTEEDHHN